MTLTDFAKVKRHFATIDPMVLCVLETVNLTDWFEDRPSDDHFVNLALFTLQVLRRDRSLALSRYKAENIVYTYSCYTS